MGSGQKPNSVTDLMKEADGTVRSLQASDLLDREAADFGALLRRMLVVGAADEASAYLGEPSAA